MSNYRFAIGSHPTHALAIGKRDWKELDGKTFASKEELVQALSLRDDLGEKEGWTPSEVVELAEDLWSLGMPLKILGDWMSPDPYGQYEIVKGRFDFMHIGDDNMLSAHLFGYSDPGRQSYV